MVCCSTNLTLLSVVCVLGLATGVYCKLSSQHDDTRVDITIFAPASFLSAKPSSVYFNLHRDTALEVDGNFNFEAFGEFFTGVCNFKDCSRLR